MRAPLIAGLLGVLCFLIAGLIKGAGFQEGDLQAATAAFYAFGACGLMGVLAGGVALGIKLARD